MEMQFMTNYHMTEELGESKQKSFLEKVKEHKREIAICATIVISTVAAVIVVKNRTAFMPDIDSLRNEAVLPNSFEKLKVASPLISQSVSKSDTSGLPIGDSIKVSRHLRTLPEGWKASPEKLGLAKKAGIVLGERQTWVDDHYKKCA